MINSCTHPTPAGGLTVLATEGVVLAAGFCRADELAERLGPVHRTEVLINRRELGPITEAITAYLAGHVTAFDTLTIEQPGTPLQHEVWDVLRAIPAGSTTTYTALAASTTRPAAVRAAGTACGRNLVAPFVPCHRAVRRDGGLGGYYYGLDVKRWLLDHERRSTS